MQIASHPVHLPSLPATRRSRLAAVVCAAALAAAAVAATIDRDGDVLTPARPAAVPSGVAGGELSAYDGALLHHHGIRVPRVTATIEPTAAQRGAAARFHHR